MINYITKRKASISYRLIVCLVAAAIALSTIVHLRGGQPIKVYANSALPYMPPPTKLIKQSPWTNSPVLKGIKLYPDDPFKFDFIIDEGDSKNLTDEQLKKESKKLIRYFLSALTIPEKDLWVNLSPYEQDRITPNELGLTDMGKDLLGQDYILKQLTSSLTYPESPLGKQYWQQIYKKSQELFGTTKIPINTFNKVWITPDKAVVYQDNNKAYIGDTHLKVMLEEDYLASQNNPQKEISVGDGHVFRGQ